MDKTGLGTNTLAAGLLIAFAAATPAQASVVVENLLFSTAGQGMWAPDKTAGAGGTNTLTIFNQSFANRTYGDIVSTRVPGTGGTVPNPAWGIWYTCKNTVNVLCGSEPSKTIANPISAQYIKNGAEVVMSNMHLDFGVKPTLEFAPGKVASDVKALVNLNLPDTPLAAGEVFTIGTAGGAGESSLASDFDLFNVGITPFVNMSAKATLEAWGAGINVIPKSTILNLDIHPELEIVGAKVGDGGVDVRIFGETAFTTLQSGAGLNIPVPGIVPPPLNKLIGFPMGDVQVWVPGLDTPPDSTYDAATNTVTNKQDTTTRLGGSQLLEFGDLGIQVNGPTTIDFAKVDVDLDVLGLYWGTPLGVSAGIPLTATVEINALDLDFGTFFGVGQELSFKPKDIAIDLAFSQAVEVETSAGVFELLDTWTITLGDGLNIRHPGVDLEITPTYRLADNVFSNLTELFLTPGFALEYMQLKFGGALFSALGAGDYKIFSTFIPVAGGPIPVHTYADTSFTLGGFDPITGGAVTVAGIVQTSALAVPAPASLPLFLAGLFGLGALRRRSGS